MVHCGGTCTLGVPLKTYTRKEIAFLFQTSIRVIEEDIKHLKIKPIEQGDYGMNLYSDRDYELIKKLREHCSESGKTRDTFIVPTPTEIVTENKQLPKINKAINNSSLIQSAMAIDPLADLELLQRISDNNWLLPTKRLAAILQISPRTLNNSSEYNHCGFICIRAEQAHRTFLWRIKFAGK